MSLNSSHGDDLDSRPSWKDIKLEDNPAGALEGDRASVFLLELRREDDSRLKTSSPLFNNFQIPQEQRLKLPNPKAKPSTIISLGDNGDTAHINEYGELMALSKYLDMGASGTVHVEPPFKTWDRDEGFRDMRTGRLPGFGLRLRERGQVTGDTLEYVHDRWPLVSYTAGPFKIQILMAIQNGTVLQQYIIRNGSDETSQLELLLDLGLGASRWMGDSRYQLCRWPRSSVSVGACGYSAVLLSWDDEEGVQMTTKLFKNGRHLALNLRSGHTDRLFDSVAVSPGVFVEDYDFLDGSTKPYHFESVKLGAHELTEFTAHYQLRRTDHAEMHQGVNFSVEDCPKDRRSSATSTNPILNEESSEKRHSIRSADGIGMPDILCAAKQTEKTPRASSINHGENDLEPFPGSTGDSDRNGLEEQSKSAKHLWARYVFDKGPPYVDVCELIEAGYHGKWLLDSSKKNLLFRRHLEHVLSVSSVSIRSSVTGAKVVALVEEHITLRDTEVWLTLVQFRYMLGMYNLLSRENVASEDLRDWLQHRIFDTCTKHLDWAFDIAKSDDGGWYPYICPNGKYIKDGYALEYSTALTGSMQIIKLFEYKRAFPWQHEFVLQKLESRLIAWLESVRAQRETNSGLWPWNYEGVMVSWFDAQYRSDEPVSLPRYELEVLTLLWKALKSVQELLDDGKRIVSSSNHDSAFQTLLQRVDASIPPTWREMLSPAKFRDLLLKRFTYELAFDPEEFPADAQEVQTDIARTLKPAQTKGPHADQVAKSTLNHTDYRRAYKKKSVLAVSWIGSEKPSVELSVWNWWLFDAAAWGFFDDWHDGGKMDVWKNSIEAQGRPSELLWIKPAECALALIMAAQGQSLDNTKDANHMYDKAMENLFSSTRANGMYPEEVDETSKWPIDTWGSYTSMGSSLTSHIFFILLQECYKCFDHSAALDPGSRNVNSPGFATRQTADLSIVRDPVPKISDTLILREEFEGWILNPSKERSKLAKNSRLQRSSTKVDQHRVYDPPDLQPDWPFPLPDYFTNKRLTLNNDTISKLVRATEINDDPMFYTVKEGAQKLAEQEYWFENRPDEPSGSFVIDLQGSYNYREQSGGLDDIQWFLRQPRTKNNAKKRFIYIDSCTLDLALILYLTSPPSEHFSVAGLLTRHRNREDFFKEHTHHEVNLWVTEFHLSFYLLLPQSYVAESSNSESIFQSVETLPSFPGEQKVSQDKVAKAAVGYRFVGDLHDRLWTAIVLSYIPGEHGSEMLKEIRNPWISELDAYLGQRKILEAIIFEQITRRVYRSTKTILSKLDTVIGQSEDGIYRGPHDYDHDCFSQSFDQSYSRSRLYMQLTDFLRHWDDSSKSTMEQIFAWENREKYRSVQPRWSTDDEAKYGAKLQEWTRLGQQNVNRLKLQRTQIAGRAAFIKHLRDGLTADMALRESRFSARSAQDVRLFTYATVIFLPLSLSASLFSMQGAPGSHTVSLFISVALVALAVTLVFLSNLRTLTGNFSYYLGSIHHTGRRKMTQSQFLFWRETSKELIAAEKATVHEEEPPRRQKQSKWWYTGFWIAFIAVELPVACVAHALEAIHPRSVRTQQLSLLHRIVRLLLGLVMFPWFVTLWTLSFLITNLKPLLRRGHSHSHEKPASSKLKDRLDKTKVTAGRKETEKSGSEASTRKEMTHERKDREQPSKDAQSQLIYTITHPPSLWGSRSTKNNDEDKGTIPANIPSPRTSVSHSHRPPSRTVTPPDKVAGPRQNRWSRLHGAFARMFSRDASQQEAV